MELSGGRGRVAGPSDDAVDAELPSGAVVRLRVADREQGLENVGRLSPKDLEKVFGTIEEVASLLKERLVAMASSRASVQFGVSLSMRAGALVALVFDGQAEASLTVTLEWDGTKDGSA
jgi:hypothetical protein